MVIALVGVLAALAGSRLIPSDTGATPEPSQAAASEAGSLADWWVDPQQLPIPPGATTIKGFLQERECASRQSPADRVVGPVIEYRSDAVVITFRVRPIGGECPSNPAFPVTITLTEPIGNRSIVDGSTGRDATVDPSGLMPASPTPSAGGDPIDDAGAFAGGGVWAVRGTALFTSTDRGQTWRAGVLPLRPDSFPERRGVVVIDAEHAWLVQNGAATTGSTGSETDVANYTVSRTTDGGRTWTTADVPGNYPGTYPALTFADPDHGFLIAAATRLSFGVTTVLQSEDGGATWVVAGTKPWLDGLVAASDAATVWAGGSEQAGGSFDQSILSVSRDAGRTWTDLQPPGLPGKTEATCGCYLAGPPVFTNAKDGHLVVVNSFGTHSPFGTWLETTSDGGRTWVQRTFRPNVEASGAAELGRDTWLMAGVNPSGFDSSSDGGRTWRAIAGARSFDGSAPVAIHALGGGGVIALLQSSGSMLHLELSADGGTTWMTIDPP
jgi:photosystem II stability/assembly factor-like uncharacterized protein